MAYLIFFFFKQNIKEKDRSVYQGFFFLRGYHHYKKGKKKVLKVRLTEKLKSIFKFGAVCYHVLQKSGLNQFLKIVHVLSTSRPSRLYPGMHYCLR